MLQKHLHRAECCGWRDQAGLQKAISHSWAQLQCTWQVTDLLSHWSRAIKTGKRICIELHYVHSKSALAQRISTHTHTHPPPGFGSCCAGHISEEGKGPACNPPAHTRCQRQLPWARSAGRMSIELLLLFPSSNNIRIVVVKRLNFAELSALEQVGLLLYN